VLQGASVVFDVVAISGRLEMLLELSQPFQEIRCETVQVEVASVALIECQCFIDGIEATLEIALVLARLCQSEQFRNPLLPLMTGFGCLQQLLSRVVGWVQANGFPTRFHCQ